MSFQAQKETNMALFVIKNWLITKLLLKITKLKVVVNIIYNEMN